jgi:urease accessory protein
MARGRALAELLPALSVFEPMPGTTTLQGLGLASLPQWKPLLARAQLAGFAFAASRWALPRQEALLGYAWAWLENLTLAAVKLVPLGQTKGQQVLLEIAGLIPNSVEVALALEDAELGGTSPALAIASSCHETQYTRLYRS